jgi:hypothetical protein
MDCINVTNDEVIVQVTDYIKHDGYVHHIGPLYRTLHQLASNLETRTLRFLCLEAEPFRLVAFDRVVEHIAKTYNLPKHRIVIDTIDHTPLMTSDFAVIKTRPSNAFVLSKEMVHVDMCVRKSEAKLFGAFFGRFTHQRFLMAYFLENDLANDSVVAFHPNIDWANYEFESVKKWYQPELQWLKDRQENNANVKSGLAGGVTINDCLISYHEIFNKYHIEMVIETNVYECGWWTEKTVKCLISGKPFLLLGTPGQLLALRDMGFKTFSPWINESYDQESNPEKRFDMLKAEMRRLSLLDESSKVQLLSEINSIADYNKNHYNSIVERYENGQYN